MTVIQRIKLSELVSDYLRDQIVKGELRSGDRIIETAVAKVVGVSQAPVREALQELEVMGLVEIIPYRGCFVLSIDKKKLLQVYALRKMLECFAAEQGIESISDEAICKMELHLKRMFDAVNNNDVKRIVKHDVLFHNEIVKSANNLMLEKMWNLVGSTHWSSIAISAYPSLDYCAESHMELLKSVKLRDASRVAKELSYHFDRASSFVLDRIDRIDRIE